MGLLDSVIGALGQSQSGVGGHTGGVGSQAELIRLVVSLLVQGGAQGGAQGGGQSGGQGGLGDLIGRFQQGGLGDVIGSWVGTGQNLPISPDQLGNVLGGDVVGQLTQESGLSQDDLLRELSQMLPQVVDQVTPQGEVPQGGLGSAADLLGQLMKR